MLEGVCALVTGSVTGLGHAVADGLAARGANVVLHGLHDATDGDEIARALADKYGTKVAFDGADLRSRDEIEQLVARANERFEGIDIVVNNAVVRHFSPIDSFSPDDWDESVAVNLSAAFNLIRLTMPGMRQKGWGRIINMSSIYGSRGAENRVDYVTTKTALIGMTRAVAVEVAKTGITCNAVCPGTVPSPAILERIEKIAHQKGISRDEAEAVYLSDRHPTGRFVSLDAVSELVCFVCGPHSSDITGTVLPIDGGWQAR